MAKYKSERQVRYLLSKVSPLSRDQRERLERELHTGKVKIGAPKRGRK